MTEMRYYSVKCEAPGGLGPDAIYYYNPTGSYVHHVDMFTGFGLRLLVTQHAKAVLCDNGVSPALFTEFRVE